VALECGFSDLSYFSRAFRRRFGASARRYRGHGAGDLL
jgi:AraC-like DNA-binding protein